MPLIPNNISHHLSKAGRDWFLLKILKEISQPPLNRISMNRDLENVVMLQLSIRKLLTVNMILHLRSLEKLTIVRFASRNVSEF